MAAIGSVRARRGELGFKYFTDCGILYSSQQLEIPRARKGLFFAFIRGALFGTGASKPCASSRAVCRHMIAAITALKEPERRWRWSPSHKVRMVESLAAGALLAEVALQRAVDAALLHRWRRGARVASRHAAAIGPDGGDGQAT